MMGLDDETLEEYNKLISGTVIPTLIRIADKHNYDRDSMIRFTADTLVAMSEIATFENYNAEVLFSE
jgi:hypothetical protein